MRESIDSSGRLQVKMQVTADDDHPRDARGNSQKTWTASYNCNEHHLPAVIGGDSKSINQSEIYG